MKKSQVNVLFNEQTKRRNRIVCISTLILIFFLISSVLFISYLKEKKGYLVYYSEKSKVDYKVFLNDNSFFENNYLDDKNRYIASLINYVNASFNYEINMNDIADFDYSYYIDAEVNVKENSSNKPLFTKKYNMLDKKSGSSNGKQQISINENLNIMYNEYNNLIQSFVNIYGLEKTNSTLTVSMHINVNGNCEKFDGNSNNSAVVSLIIPLTTKTVGIDIKNNLVESNDKVMICKNKSSLLQMIFLGLSIVFLTLSILTIIFLVRFIRKTRTDRNIYDIELKKILNYYYSYIQKVQNKIVITGDNVIQIDGESFYKNCYIFRLNNFTDMLEIRDSLNMPIVMSTNATNTVTTFIIADALNKSVYAYELRVNNKKRKTIKRRIDN